MLKDLPKSVREGLRIPPEDTLGRADRSTRGSLPHDPFVNTQIALHRLVDFVVELHDVIRTGLNAAGSTHDAPAALLHGHVLRKTSLNFIKGLDPDTRFQMRHLSTGSGIVDLFLRLRDCLQYLIST